MKKISSLFLAILIFGHIIVQPIYAAGATESIHSEIGNAIGLKINGKTSADATIGDVLSALLPYLYIAGGLILFVMIIWGGFEMLAGATEQKSQEAGKQRITAAAIGFILLFVSYWIAQILQIVFGITILGK